MGLLNWAAKRVERAKRIKEGDNYINIVEESREYNAALNAMGLSAHTEKGQQMREIGMLEITSKKFEFLNNYKQDLFLQQATEKTVKIIEDKSKGGRR